MALALRVSARDCGSDRIDKPKQGPRSRKGYSKGPESTIIGGLIRNFEVFQPVLVVGVSFVWRALVTGTGASCSNPALLKNHRPCPLLKSFFCSFTRAVQRNSTLRTLSLRWFMGLADEEELGWPLLDDDSPDKPDGPLLRLDLDWPGPEIVGQPCGRCQPWAPGPDPDYPSHADQCLGHLDIGHIWKTL